MVPKAALVVMVVGIPKLVWLRTLKNSDRNCRLDVLADPEVLVHRQVPLLEVGSAERVAAQIAERIAGGGVVNV